MAFGILYNCLRKIAYPTFDAAETAAKQLMDDIRDGLLKRSKPGSVFPYRCPLGNHWHIGHAPRRSARKGASRRVGR